MTATRTAPDAPLSTSPPSDTTTPSARLVGAAADLGLLALALGTAAAFIRVFDDWSFMTRLALPLIAAWAIALLLRRLHVPTLISCAIHTGIGVVLLTVMFGGGTGLFGIPTPDTFRLLSDSVTTSF
ncbi:hypothetical protein BH10ACT3_BH10ACT3_20530 [soil metagenome]